MPPRLKPIQKVEGGVTNGVTPQPPAGLSDISAQVQQYQQFLGEKAPEIPPKSPAKNPKSAKPPTPLKTP